MGNLTRCLLVLLVSGLAGQLARAATIFQTGFEPPTYSTGQLLGQSGWINSPFPFVETSNVFSGSHAAEFDAGTDTVTNPVFAQSLAAQPISYSSVGNPNQLVRFQAEFYVATGSVKSNWDAIAIFGNSGFLAQFVVQTNDVVILGTLNSVLGSAPAIYGQWNSYEIDINYSSDIVSGYINGSLIGSGPLSVPDTSATEFTWGVNSANGSTDTDKAFIDNISITSSAVPEPSSVILAGIAAGVLIVVYGAQCKHRLIGVNVARGERAGRFRRVS